MVPDPMRRTGYRIAYLLAAAALALPAAAWGQSAGDEQYEDPFAGEDQEQPEPTPAPDTSTSDPGVTQTAQTAPAPTATTAQSSPAAQEELPRTGADEGLVALAGGVLLASGFALRRRTS
jgi:LPXTG-motif cell wall-anchored protein